MSADLATILKRDLRGSFAVPDTIAPAAADSVWFAEHGRVSRNPQSYSRVPRVPDGQCWHNGLRATMRDARLRYVQGLVHPAHRNLLVAHARCVDDAGTPYEPTWNVNYSTGAEVYVGVVLTLEDLMGMECHIGTIGWYHDFADLLTRRRSHDQ